MISFIEVSLIVVEAEAEVEVVTEDYEVVAEFVLRATVG